MKLVYGFNVKDTPNLTEVGGKGFSLILMTQQGLPVPPGFVLSVDFFKPWFNYIKDTTEWLKVISSPTEALKSHTDALKKICRNLKLDSDRKKALENALKDFDKSNQNLLFAVRSSSPEEDLEGASFAGGYETVLGVKREAVEDALRRSFASSLDERVFMYKKEHGFPLDNPEIAVIVQLQIHSDSAGVAFSLNPLNNCYDEAVINANFGQGESVVSGLASPDTFIVDKITNKILDRKIGKKEISLWLAPDGGTYEKALPTQEKVCLKDEAVLSLVNMVKRVEAYYEKPVDIEWAFSAEKLYLLQARPITAYIPLHKDMQTAPGQPKLLYLDATLAKQGIHDPLSVMGTDYLSIFQSKLEEAMTGRNSSGVMDGIQGFFQGRMYLNISNNIKLYGKKKLVNTYRLIDMPSAEIIENTDDEYIPKALPPRLRGVLRGTILNNLSMIFNVFKALKSPQKYEKLFVKRTMQYTEELKNEGKRNLPIQEFAETTTLKFVSLFVMSFPILAAIAISKSGIEKIFKDSAPEIINKATFLEKALPNNVTTQMGLSMYQLSLYEEINSSESFEMFKRGIEEKVFSPAFINAWEGFMEKYGFRCPKELDIATPRYYEQPEVFYHQLKSMAKNTDFKHNPQFIFNEARRNRENDFSELLNEAKKKGKEKKFKKYYDMLITFSGYREAPKYYWIMTVAEVRKKVMEAAKALVASGRIDDQDQVFDLTMDDLTMAMEDSTLDLRLLASKNTMFLNRLKNIKEFPRVIDSRGKILYPPKRKAQEGELIGEPISPGTVRGPVKVLKSPHEKPVLMGEILVAKATDPGWTPLFINAAGIILEVGGMLQHGALVAREYGKPCVSGIEDAVSILKDGQMVEIDGLNGVIRLL